MKQLISTITYLMFLTVNVWGTNYTFTVKTTDGATLTCQGSSDGKVIITKGSQDIWTSRILTIPSTIEKVYTSANSYISGKENNVVSIGNSAFYAEQGVSTIVIPNSVSSIGEGAFSSCGYLSSMTIPNSVVSIGRSAFSDCTQLSEVKLSNSLEKIPIELFQNCKNLQSVIIPESVTEIDDFAFFDCNKLSELSIPANVKTIGSTAVLLRCYSLSKIEVDANNQNYDSRGGCNAIIETKTNKLLYGCKNTVIPNGIVEIASNAFYGCNTMTSISIPSTVKTIGFSAFRECSGLKSVIIPSSIENLDEAFSECDNLIEVTVMHKTPLTIKKGAFSNRANATLYVPAGSKVAYEAADYWKEFKDIVEISPIIDFADANVKVLCVANWDTNGDGELSEAEAAAVKNLGEVFKNNTDITSFNELQYFTGLTSIGSNVFSGCSGLMSVTIPSSVKSIGTSAFYGCSGLTSVTIPNSVGDIGYYAFYGCSNIASLNIGSGVKSIGDDAFNGCTDLTKVELNSNVIVSNTYTNMKDVFGGQVKEYIIGENVTSIGDNTFSYCSNLTSVTIPSSVISIGELAFSHCSKLTSVTIPNSVTSIGDMAFDVCTGLTSVTIGNNVTTIGVEAFYHCFGLTSVTIPNSVTSIGTGAFFECSGLTEVTISNSVTSIEKSVFCGCAGLTEVTIPNSVTLIGESAFYGCSGLTSVAIPNSVTSIGNMAFSSCSGLTSVTIPNSVTSIGSSAFDACAKLTKVTIKKPNPLTIQSNTFSNRANATLYVPAGSKATYAAANYWKNFKEIVEMAPEGLKDGDTFEESGMTYQVVSASDKTVKLTRGANTGSIVSIPSEVYGYKVTAIGKAAFRELSNITAVTIPNSVVTMERSVFDDCANLTSVSIPSSVTSIGERLFTGCKQLTSVTVANDNPVYDSRNNCNAIIETATNTLVVGCIASVIPDGVVKIGAKAFEDIRGLVSISIPEGVACIEEMAFFDCSNLEEVTLPSSLTDFAVDAFSDCPSITKVTSHIAAPFAIDKWTFGVEDTNYTDNFNPVVYNSATLYVPYGTKSLYEATEGWKDFKEIIEIVPQPTDISTLADAIYVEVATALKGSYGTMSISMKNTQATSAYSFDLLLPDGVTVDSYTLSSRHNGHAETMNRNETTGAYSFAVLSLQSKEIKESDGVIWTLKLNVADNVEAGDYAVKIQNAKYSLANGSTSIVLPEVVSLLTIEEYIKGDANGDGTVDIADAVCIVNRIVGKATPSYIDAAADANADGVVDIADAVRIVNLVVGKIPALAPRFDWNLPKPQ